MSHLINTLQNAFIKSFTQFNASIELSNEHYFIMGNRKVPSAADGMPIALKRKDIIAISVYN